MTSICEQIGCSFSVKYRISIIYDSKPNTFHKDIKSLNLCDSHYINFLINEITGFGYEVSEVQTNTNKKEKSK